MNKKFLVVVIVLTTVFAFPFVKEIKAGVDDNVSGWAWSDNIDWVSFNCTNEDNCGTSDYGVNINEDGTFTGHAWSENVGWIDFSPSGPYPDLPDYSTKVSLETGEVSGWARALSYGGGWDGWVSFSGSGWACGDNVTFTYKGEQVTYGTVQKDYGGGSVKCWMDRNLGASQVATAYNDSAAYGDLFQWGRLDDGHQTRTSGTTPTLSSTDNPGHGNFILAPNSPYDWRSPRNDNLWQGVAGINNPCPDGWRIPIESEWEAERQSWSENNYNGAFASPLKLTAGGGRHYGTGSPDGVGTSGPYWSSGVSDTYARYLFIYSTGASMSSSSRAYGRPVRCVQDADEGSIYGATVDFDEGEFLGYAWSDEVIGWLSFNCANEGVCGTADYKVLTSFSPAPSITNFSNEFPAPCSQSRIPTFSWETDAELPYDYDIRLCSDSSCNNELFLEEIRNTNSTSWAPACVYTCSISPYDNIDFGGGAYYGQVRVRDLGGRWSGWAISGFTTHNHAYPYADFLCDGANCEEMQIYEDVIVTLANSSTTYDGLVSCSWTLPAIAEVVEGNPASDCELQVKFSPPPPGQREQDIELSVIDSSSYSCSETKTIEVRFPLPEYKETSPTAWLRNFLASLFARVTSIFKGL